MIEVSLAVQGWHGGPALWRSQGPDFLQLPALPSWCVPVIFMAYIGDWSANTSTFQAATGEMDKEKGAKPGVYNLKLAHVTSSLVGA